MTQTCDKAFQCRKCGQCCYGEGGIFVNSQEIDRIAAFLEMKSKDFLDRYCENRHGRFYIVCGDDRYCVFYHKKKGCLIHPVKPARCALWPYFPAIVNDRDNWLLAMNACPGINPDCAFEEFVRQGKVEFPHTYH
jgi:hypothetical protein